MSTYQSRVDFSKRGLISTLSDSRGGAPHAPYFANFLVASRAKMANSSQLHNSHGGLAFSECERRQSAFHFETSFEKISVFHENRVASKKFRAFVVLLSKVAFFPTPGGVAKRTLIAKTIEFCAIIRVFSAGSYHKKRATPRVVVSDNRNRNKTFSMYTASLRVHVRVSLSKWSDADKLSQYQFLSTQ